MPRNWLWENFLKRGHYFELGMMMDVATNANHDAAAGDGRWKLMTTWENKKNSEPLKNLMVNPKDFKT